MHLLPMREALLFGFTPLGTREIYEVVVALRSMKDRWHTSGPGTAAQGMVYITMHGTALSSHMIPLKDYYCLKRGRVWLWVW